MSTCLPGHRTRWHAWILGGLVGLLVPALCSSLASTALAGDNDQYRPSSARAQFTSPCSYSHTANDDPIVFPGRPGFSHAHDFFGNRTTNAYSTYESLVQAPRRCWRRADTAAYWVPTVMPRLLPPRDAHVYYTAGGKDPTRIRAFPPGLKMVAGDPHAERPQPSRITRWRCEKGETFRPDRPVPLCAKTSFVVLEVRFPDCWDGKRTDSGDHSHMAYSERRRGGRFKFCPVTHPVAVPAIGFNARYRSLSATVPLTLSSGSPHSGHADFFNAWDQTELERLVRECINAQKRCGRGPAYT